MNRRKEIEGHLFMIEEQYGVHIVNKEEVCERIALETDDSRRILSIALSLNHWMALHGGIGDLTIPIPILEKILAAVR